MLHFKLTSIYLSQRNCCDRTHVTSDTHQSCGRQDDDDRAPVVEAEDMVVDAGLVPFVEQARHRPEDHVKHFESFPIFSLVDIYPSHLISRSSLPELAVNCWTLPCSGSAAPILSVQQ